jgi:hypothetical protein
MRYVRNSLVGMRPHILQPASTSPTLHDIDLRFVSKDLAYCDMRYSQYTYLMQDYSSWLKASSKNGRTILVVSLDNVELQCESHLLSGQNVKTCELPTNTCHHPLPYG